MSDSTGIDLPHGAWYDDETNTVNISLNRITLSLSVVEFFTFNKQMSDITQVLEQMLQGVEEVCDECGCYSMSYEVKPPDESEYH